MKSSKNFIKPVLLAPVGNREALIGAVRGGADAVYLGLRDFNARGRAANFTYSTYITAKNYLKEEGVKLYLTLNTLIREGELKNLNALISFLKNYPPDALIVQDLGVAALCQKRVPEIPLHASTQMSVHNSPGVWQLHTMGYTTAILSRECTVEEISKIKEKSPDEIAIEVFVHGALCFSFSGQCLFSSFIGGLSANRGKCAQPCRRMYKTKGKKEALFSPHDLNGGAFIKDLIATDNPESLPMTLKLEGRLKTAPYVYKVTQAYRKIIDSIEQDRLTPNVVSSVNRELSQIHNSRRTSSGFFDGKVEQMVKGRGKQEFAATFAGTVQSVTKEGFRCVPTVKLEPRYRIMLFDPRAEQRLSCRIEKLTDKQGKELKTARKGTAINVHTSLKNFKKGMEVYVTDSDKSLANEFGRIWKSVAAKAKDLDLQAKPPPVRGPVKSLYRKLNVKKGARKGIFIRADNFSDYRKILSLKNAGGLRNQGKQNSKNRDRGKPGDRDTNKNHQQESGLFLQNAHTVILELNEKNIRGAQKGNLEQPGLAICWEIPPLLFEGDINNIRKQIRDLQHRGNNNWMIQNLGHIQLLDWKLEPEVIAGFRLNVMNNYSGSKLLKMGMKGFTLSPELDRRDFQIMGNHQASRYALLHLLFKPPLFLSRMELKATSNNQEVNDGKANYCVKKKGDLTEVQPESHIDLTGQLAFLKKQGFGRFIVDYSLISGGDNRKKSSQKPQKSSFNFRRGLK